MSTLWNHIKLWITRQISPDGEFEIAWERISRELQGSIFILMGIFTLFSFFSYLPIDWYYFTSEQYLRIKNLGGIVGTILSELYLGTMGLAGYGVLFLLSYITFLSFKGVSLRTQLMKIVSSHILMLWGAIFCFIVFQSQAQPESFWVGGSFGTFLGSLLVKFFQFIGALLIVLGGVSIILMMQFGFSLSTLFSYLKEKLSKSPSSPDNIENTDSLENIFLPILKSAEKTGFHTAPPAEKKTTKKTTTKKNKKRKSSDQKPISPTITYSDSGELNLPDLDEEETQNFDVPSVSGSFVLPSLRLIKAQKSAKKPAQSDLTQKAQELQEHLKSFNVTGEIKNISIGPVVITFEFKPDAGIKLKSIKNLQEDLGIILGNPKLRIIAPIPGKTVVGIEVPRETVDVISFKELVNSPDFTDPETILPIAIGKKTDGQTLIADLAKMPHLLVAGATGSGKSVFINSLIMSLLYRYGPQQLRFVMIDPKMLELNTFNGIPHMISPVVTEPKEAKEALSWAVDEMERRYRVIAEFGSKNIDSYNKKNSDPSKKIPYIVVVIDELADLMMTVGQEVEISITRLAQKARAAGIHLVIATQRPSTDVITGIIKANIPSRISFKLPSSIDSRTILDSTGAEELLGKGDNLIRLPGKPVYRTHGCFITEEELKRVTRSIRNQATKRAALIDFAKKLKKNE